MGPDGGGEDGGEFRDAGFREVGEAFVKEFMAEGVEIGFWALAGVDFDEW